MENSDVFSSSTAPLMWHGFLERMRHPSAAEFVKVRVSELEYLQFYSVVFEQLHAPLSSIPCLQLASHVTVSDQHEIVIRDVEPLVFKVLLHFIYSDTLPENERRSLMAGYAFRASLSSTIGAKLLAAADKYDIRRLKSICESHLWRSISLGRFPEILSLAETYNATEMLELKHLCFKYAADNYDVLAELGSFSYFQKDCPWLLSNGPTHSVMISFMDQRLAVEVTNWDAVYPSRTPFEQYIQHVPQTYIDFVIPCHVNAFMRNAIKQHFSQYCGVSVMDGVRRPRSHLRFDQFVTDLFP